MLKNVLPTFLNPWFIRSESKNLIKKEFPKVFPKSLATLDTNQNSKHLYGEFFAAEVEPLKNPPSKLNDHQAKLALIHVDRQKPRQGLLEVNLDKDKKSYVFFSLKSVQSQQKSFGDLTNLLRVNAKEKLSVNASLVDAKSKIPYVATSVWKTNEDPPRKSGADLRNVTEEYKKCSEGIIRDWMNRTIELAKKKDAGIEDSMKKAEEALSRAEGRQRDKDTKEKSPEPKDDDKEKEREGDGRAYDENGEWRWEPSFKDKLGQVHKVVNNNFALGVGYHTIGWEEKRFFVLFDTCDVWINGEVLQKLGKTMKDVVSENDHIKFHAVHVDTKNSWNMFYVATAVIVNKTMVGARDEEMPRRALMKESSSELAPAKVATFKTVSEKLTKKTCPPDPNEKEREELMKKKKEEIEKRRAFEKKRREQERKRIEIERDRADRQAQLAAQEAEKKAAARRRELMSKHPEILAELQGMEIQRGTSRMYSCKLCGIQAMNLFDAESHIKEDDHKSLKEKQEGGNKVISREEAEEALFLNEFKEIKAGVFRGRRVYTCEKCKANNLPLEPMKKHTMSLMHKSNHKMGDNSAQLDQECKEMKKKGRNSISYFCTPCGFTSDSVISTKNHIQEADHKKRTVNYCHACKLFSNSKGKFTEHRFSIAHKRTMEQLEKPFEEKEEKDKAAKEKKKQERKEREEAESKQAEAELPKEPEDPLKCKVCNFEAEDEDEMKSHSKTESHRRKYYLTHGKMPSEDAEDGDEGQESPFDSLKHMGLAQRAKEINEEANKSRSMVVTEETKKEKNDMIDKLFKENIFEKLTETTIKCTSCEVKLQGHAQQKKLYAQLFVHLISDKHLQRLRVHIKAEEVASREELAVVEEETVPETAEAGEEEETVPLPDPITVSQYQDCTDEEMLDMFRREREREEEDEDNPVKKMVDLKNKTDNLLYCVPCKTGLMSGKFMARHWDSQAHKDKIPPAPWRSLLDLSFVLEFGNLYKCLYCNSGFMNLRQLESHIMTLYHKDNKENCLNEDDTFDQNIPLDPPRCDICDKYFTSELDVRCHNLTKLHSIRIDQANCYPISKFTDNDDVVEKLECLPAPDLPILPSRLQNQKGHIAGIFESGQFVVIQFSISDAKVHALFDKSRVANKDRSTFPVVGFPVLFNACKIEPEVGGVSGYVQYWASSVVMGDGVRSDSLGTELTYSQLRREEGPIIDMGLEDSKAELKAQVDLRMSGCFTVFLDNHSEYLDGETGIVCIKTPSCVVIRLHSSGMNALYMLEDTSLTELQRDTKEEDLDLEPGAEVSVTGVLMDVSRQAQYLVTSVWKHSSISGVRRDKLQQSAIEMYHTLALSLPPPQPFLGDIFVPTLDTMADMSGVIDVGQLMAGGGIGHDDLVADDSIADHGLAAENDDLAASDDISDNSEQPKKSFGIKIASFAN